MALAQMFFWLSPLTNEIRVVGYTRFVESHITQTAVAGLEMTCTRDLVQGRTVFSPETTYFEDTKGKVSIGRDGSFKAIEQSPQEVRQQGTASKKSPLLKPSLLE